MRAIILAAGGGTRLRPLTNDLPKCLVPLGPQPLVDHQLQALRAVGVEDIVLVVGYLADQVRRHCGDSVRYVENRQFATTNSIYSLYVARHELDADTFLFNCDIIFHVRLLERMLAAPPTTPPSVSITTVMSALAQLRPLPHTTMTVADAQASALFSPASPSLLDRPT